MSQLQSAINLAKKGFHVFPLSPNSKLPAIDDYPNRASRDPEQLRKWWIDPVLEIEQPFNVGISTTKFADDEALVVIDVDNKGQKRGDEEILRLEFDGFELPSTFEQTTPTGGRHLVYRSKQAFKQGVNILGKGLDVRAKGGYIVGAGSYIEGKQYEVIERDIARPPQWLISKLKQSHDKPEAPQVKVVESLDQARAKARALRYLEKEAPLSIEGDGGDETAYKVACRVKDLGVDQTTAFELLFVNWNPRCAPPWSAEELESKVENAYRYGTETVGVASPEADFDSLSEPVKRGLLTQLNDNHAFILEGGGYSILNETVHEDGTPKRDFLSEPTFKALYKPKKVPTEGKAVRTIADAWLEWEHRREYAGICFAPERKPRHNYYNLWRGFTCKPITPEQATADQKRGLQMFLDHAKENVCLGDEKLFKWLIGYFAHMIQHPYERPLTTLVFKGSKGTGKNTLVDRVGNLLGSSHYLVAQDGRYLTSNFNGHMDSCLMLVLDEAFWSGDKTAEGKLKGLTTAPKILIERKGKEPYVVDNLVRLVVIGNEDWLVPASHDERRYAVFQMGEGKKQNREYFKTMRVLLDEKGGCGLLLHFLQTFDLTQVDVNDAPKTDALLNQKLLSADPIEQWWVECLQEGRIASSDFADEWNTQVDKDQVRDAFKRYTKERNIKSRIPTEIAFGKMLTEFCKSLVRDQKRRDGKKLIRVYRFPELDQARKEYENHIGHEVNWNE